MALRGSYKTGPGMGLSPDSLCDEICRKPVAYADALIVALAGIAARPLTWASGRAWHAPARDGDRSRAAIRSAVTAETEFRPGFRAQIFWRSRESWPSERANSTNRRIQLSNLAPSSASVANAGAEMVRELLYREQGGRELAPCIIAEERPANQAGLSTWTSQFRKVARRTHIANWTMNTHGCL